MIDKTLKARFESYLFLTRKIKRTSSFESHLRRFLLYFENYEFSRDGWNDYLLILLKTQQPQSTNIAAQIAKRFDDFMKTSHMEGYEEFMREEREVETLTIDEINKLKSAWITYDTKFYKNTTLILNHTYQTLVEFLAVTGCRIEEALSLTSTDLYPDPYSVVFRRTKSRHSVKSRRIPIPKHLYDKLRHITKDRYIFTTSQGGKLYTANVDRDLKRRALYCGIHKKIYCHLFRHSFISECVKRGVPITMVSRYVGHENIQTTNKYYTHLDLIDLQVAVSSHPLLQEHLTLDILADRIKLYVDRLAVGDRFTIRYKKSPHKLSLTVE